MRTKICLLLCIVLVTVMFSKPGNAVSADNKPLLSEMTESECLDFVKDSGVMLPDLRDNESDWGPFVKEIIMLTEENPNIVFGINYTVTADLAEEIRNVVNAYYGIDIHNLPTNLSNHSTTYAATWLEHSEVYGEWDETFRNYNCYAYVLGYGFALDPGAVAYIKDNPKDIIAVGYVFNFYECDARQIADIVSNDLYIRGMERIVIEVNQMDTSNLCTEEEIICLRIGPNDYHFMRFTSDGWLHKPSRTQILKYKIAPTYDKIWNNERVIDGDFHPYTTTYNSEIYFISYNGHNWTLTKNNDGKHTKICDICDDEIIETCELDYACVNHYYHKGTCADCGYITSKIPCEYTYVGNGSGKHTATCTVCGGSAQLSCTLSYTYYSNNRHRASCSVCKKNFYKNCVIGYTYTGDNNTNHTHTGGCEVCGHTTTSNNTACTFELVFAGTYSGVNKHKSVCSVCDHVKPDLALCLYKNGNTCTLCGTHKDVHSTAAAGESTEAE